MAAGSLKVIKRRIQSVKSTQQITRAMQLVASSKLRKIEPKAVSMQPYMKGFVKIIENHLKRFPFIENKFYQKTEGKTIMIVISSDKGLCGNFNSLLLKESDEEIKKIENTGKSVDVITVGKKGRLFYQKKKNTIIKSFDKLDDKNYKDILKELNGLLTSYYLKSEYAEVKMIFTKYYSTVRKEPVTISLLPFDRDGFREIIDIMEHVNLDKETKPEFDEPFSTEIEYPENDFIYNPDPEKIFSFFAKVFYDMLIEMALIESLASEYSSRMMAMKSATDNADDMISKLHLFYNRARQAAITNEIADITGGVEALRNR